MVENKRSKSCVSLCSLRSLRASMCQLFKIHKARGECQERTKFNVPYRDITIDRRRFTDRLKDISPIFTMLLLFSLRQVSNRVEISMSAILIYRRVRSSSFLFFFFLFSLSILLS